MFQDQCISIGTICNRCIEKQVNDLHFTKKITSVQIHMDHSIVHLFKLIWMQSLLKGLNLFNFKNIKSVVFLCLMICAGPTRSHCIYSRNTELQLLQ